VTHLSDFSGLQLPWPTAAKAALSAPVTDLLSNPKAPPAIASSQSKARMCRHGFLIEYQIFPQVVSRLIFWDRPERSSPSA
jgi:hypothetical protein